MYLKEIFAGTLEITQLIHFNFSHFALFMTEVLALVTKFVGNIELPHMLN